MNGSKKVGAVIVTYNRKELLKVLLESLLNQTYGLSGIILVDNNSADGTQLMLMEMGVISKIDEDAILRNSWNGVEIYYYRSSVNSGGSGGFAKAFEIAKELSFDCIWAMDDDVNPAPDCLKNMIKYLDDEAKACIPCRGDEYFDDYAIGHYDLDFPFYCKVSQRKRNKIFYKDIHTPFVYVEDMAFEGPLIDMDVVRQIGVPNAKFFILYDDTEYAQRICQVTKIRYVAGAKLKRMLAMNNSNVAWCWKNYYDMRNSVYFERRYGHNIGVKYLSPILKVSYLILKSIVKRKPYRIKWYLKAYIDGAREKMGKTYGPSDISTETVKTAQD